MNKSYCFKKTVNNMIRQMNSLLNSLLNIYNRNMNIKETFTYLSNYGFLKCFPNTLKTHVLRL